MHVALRKGQDLKDNSNVAEGHDEIWGANLFQICLKRRGGGPIHISLTVAPKEIQAEEKCSSATSATPASHRYQQREASTLIVHSDYTA